VKKFRLLKPAQRATVAVAFVSFVAISIATSGASDSTNKSYSCANARTGARAVIAGEVDGDTANLIAAKHCKGDIVAAGEPLRALYGYEKIMHGAIVKLP
jgi:hypothetical protein